MMKNSDKVYKKRKMMKIGSLSLLAIVLILFIPNVFTVSKTQNHKDKVIEQEAQIDDNNEEDVVSDQKEKKELYLMDYDDLVDNKITKDDIYGKKSEDSTEDKEDSAEPGTDNPKTSQNKSDEGSKSSENTNNIVKSNTDQNNVSNENGVTIIDESPNTIKDETIQNEYNGEESQKPIEFFDVEPEKGPDVNGDVPAGGKQNVGTWN